ncbi:MAG: hypothetical protein JXR88_06505 [Clostridia bacterium]|nr:hypothetical protein [Clostridia bacterium]
MIENAKKDFDYTLYDPSTVIGEFSGRDSVAAILKAFEREDINYVLPVASFSSTEYGDFNTIYNNYEKTLAYVNKHFKGKKILYPLYEYNRPDLWHLFIGRKMSLITERYGFISPCIGCHLYFHLTKIPFARFLSKRIISGERDSHDGKLKVNQLNESLETYKEVLNSLGYELIMPLQHEILGKAIQDLIGWTWEEGEDHPKCVLSGNYRDKKNKAIFDMNQMISYFEEYLKPAGQIVGQHLLNELNLDELKVALNQL